MHSDNDAVFANVLRPSESGSLLDGDPCFHVGRKHIFSVVLVLMLEEVPGWHADHPRFHAFCAELLIRIHTQLDLTATGHEDYVGLSSRSISHDVSAFRNASGRGVLGPIKGRQGLSAKH